MSSLQSLVCWFAILEWLLSPSFYIVVGLSLHCEVSDENSLGVDGNIGCGLCGSGVQKEASSARFYSYQKGGGPNGQGFGRVL